MASGLFGPIAVRYRGLFADEHFVDAQQFANSIHGASRIANSICDFVFTGEASRNPRAYPVRFYVGPAKENGFLQELFALLNPAQLTIYDPLVLLFARKLIEVIFNLLIERVTSSKSDTKDILDILKNAETHNQQITTQLLAGHLENATWMRSKIDQLIDGNRAPMRELVDPVGKSVRTVQIGESSNALVIDEPVASALRSRDQIAVGDTAVYLSSWRGSSKRTGRVECACSIVGTWSLGKLPTRWSPLKEISTLRLCMRVRNFGSWRNQL